MESNNIDCLIEETSEDSNDFGLEKKKYPMQIDFNPETARILYLGIQYKLDLDLLFLLYAYLKDKLYLIFLLFENKKLVLPTANKLFKSTSDAKKIFEELSGNEATQEYGLSQSLKIKNEMLKLIDLSNKTINLEVTVNERIIR